MFPSLILHESATYNKPQSIYCGNPCSIITVDTTLIATFQIELEFDEGIVIKKLVLFFYKIFNF